MIDEEFIKNFERPKIPLLQGYFKQKEVEKSGKEKAKRKTYNKSVIKNYHKHKNKWYSRSRTLILLKKGIITLERKCKECPTTKNLQIHHEIYPTVNEKIIQAVKDGKIYYLCKEHHSKITKHTKRTKKQNSSIKKRLIVFKTLKVEKEIFLEFKRIKNLLKFKTYSQFLNFLIEGK